jgi:charged multivesicular body protein 5
MRRILGKKKPTGPAPSLGDAGARVDSRVKALDEKIAGLDKELVNYRNQLKKAKGSAATNIKRRAMETLKRKKMYENQRDQLAGQQFNIEQTSFAIDSIKDTQTTVGAMKDANKQIKAEFKKMNLSEIEVGGMPDDPFHDNNTLTCKCPFSDQDTVDDLADMMEDMNEVNDMLSRSYNVGDEVRSSTKLAGRSPPAMATHTD